MVVGAVVAKERRRRVERKRRRRRRREKGRKGIVREFGAWSRREGGKPINFTMANSETVATPFLQFTEVIKV